MKPNKTTENDNGVSEYVDTIKDETKRSDCNEMIALISKQTGLQPKMWGTAIIGFGSYHYKYDSGREGDAPLAAFSARANAIVFYLAVDANSKDELLKKLGKHKTGKGCIYVHKLADIDKKILLQMVSHSIEYNKKKHNSPPV